MWYFAWILGTSLAISFGVLNALWYEIGNEGEKVCSNSCGSKKHH
jgi:cytochrome bd-I ubiquinol oxidase subunit X